MPLQFTIKLIQKILATRNLMKIFIRNRSQMTSNFWVVKKSKNFTSFSADQIRNLWTSSFSYKASHIFIHEVIHKGLDVIVDHFWHPFPHRHAFFTIESVLSSQNLWYTLPLGRDFIYGRPLFIMKFILNSVKPLSQYQYLDQINRCPWFENIALAKYV